jgi:transcriptional regulator with XRE-family HTH domain
MDRAQRVGANIKRFRKLAGLTKSELARRVKVSPTAVHNWEENGVMPRLEAMIDLERELEVSWVQLKNLGSEKKPASTGFDPSAASNVSRGERLEQFKRQIAALFDVAADKVEIIVRT